MIDRRHFFKASLKYSLSLMTLSASGGKRQIDQSKGKRPTYKMALSTPTKLFNESNCWHNPIIGVIPNIIDISNPHVMMTMNLADLSGTDCYKQMSGMHSDVGGGSWSAPYRIESLSPRKEVIDGVERPVAVTGFSPKYHSKSGKMLGIGHTVAYTQDWKVEKNRPRHTAFSVFDAGLKEWTSWQKMEMHEQEKFFNAGAGSVQRFDQPDGSILLPFYFYPSSKNSRVAVARCHFNGRTLHCEEYGEEIGIDDSSRGLHEPSITQYNGTYFLTIRNDLRGYVTTSEDGLNFEPIQSWKFDDGEDLGNYNTQQHWVTHSDGLFLVYARRGAKNDHVFRHSAPLFIAEVDPQRLCVIRETENILIPERGARLCNFGVTDVSPNETWVTVAEYMKPLENKKYGSDGSVFVARIHWDSPNKLFNL